MDVHGTLPEDLKRRGVSSRAQRAHDVRSTSMRRHRCDVMTSLTSHQRRSDVIMMSCACWGGGGGGIGGDVGLRKSAFGVSDQLSP